ncbi:Golgi reassembly-stacking protein 2 [Perkinsus olseni]|uniref:Golgi reassembly-stacking protein 2 n=1 Tax=Perkinsus olseni TaxID=32597 RepID=A0A7J6KXF3_PEROL|nr:Golgi reassembly-stacking protein 2 [Perkinsus olseni]
MGATESTDSNPDHHHHHDDDADGDASSSNTSDDNMSNNQIHGSSSDDDDTSSSSSIDPGHGGGFRIMSVREGSPAHMAGLEAYFDYIVGLDGMKVSENHDDFFNAVMERNNDNIDNTTTTTILLCSSHGLLGITLHYEQVDDGRSHGLRVLQVFPNSPADHAGLTPGDDYLIQIVHNNRILRDVEDLKHEFDEYFARDDDDEANDGVVGIKVYNSRLSRVWIADISPSYDWGGGEGCLGCDLGQGLLHRIPPLQQQQLPADDEMATKLEGDKTDEKIDDDKVEESAGSPQKYSDDDGKVEMQGVLDNTDDNNGSGDGGGNSPPAEQQQQQPAAAAVAATTAAAAFGAYTPPTIPPPPPPPVRVEDDKVDGNNDKENNDFGDGGTREGGSSMMLSSSILLSNINNTKPVPGNIVESAVADTATTTPT